MIDAWHDPARCNRGMCDACDTYYRQEMMGELVMDTTAVRGEVVSKVSESFGPEMAEYVDQSMGNDPDSPFVAMVNDAVRARDMLAQGKAEEARDIIATYRTMARNAGFEALFDIMMDSLGLGI